MITDSLKNYFKDINKYEPLTLEEEQELAKRIKNGDSKALEKLIKHNLKIVIVIANKNRGRGIDVEDLIQQGNLGLYEAAIRYDGSKNVKFASFASTRILKMINQLIDQSGRIVRIPVNQEYERYLAIKRGEEVENISAVRIDEFAETKNSKRKEDVGSFILKTEADIDNKIEEEDVHYIVKKLLSSLKERDRKIIELYYGISSEKEVSTKDIAKQFGLTQVRVCQIINSAKLKFKKQMIS